MTTKHLLLMIIFVGSSLLGMAPQACTLVTSDNTTLPISLDDLVHSHAFASYLDENRTNPYVIHHLPSRFTGRDLTRIGEMVKNTPDKDLSPEEILSRALLADYFDIPGKLDDYIDRLAHIFCIPTDLPLNLSKTAEYAALPKEIKKIITEKMKTIRPEITYWLMKSLRPGSLKKVTPCSLGRLNQFAKNGTLLLTSNTNSIKAYDCSSHQEVQNYTAHTDYIYDLIVAGDGLHFVTSSKDGTACLWHVDSNEPIQKFVGHDAPIEKIALTHDRSLLATCGGRKIIIWDANSGMPIHTFTPQSSNGQPPHLVFIPGKELLAYLAIGSSLEVWDQNTGIPVAYCPGEYDAMTIDKNAHWFTLFSSNQHQKEVTLQNLRYDKQLKFNLPYSFDNSSTGVSIVYPHALGSDGNSFSSDGKYLAVCKNNMISITDLTTHQSFPSPQGLSEMYHACAFLPKSSILVMLTSNLIKFFDVKKREVIYTQNFENRFNFDDTYITIDEHGKNIIINQRPFTRGSTLWLQIPEAIIPDPAQAALLCHAYDTLQLRRRAHYSSNQWKDVYQSLPDNLKLMI